MAEPSAFGGGYDLTQGQLDSYYGSQGVGNIFGMNLPGTSRQAQQIQQNTASQKQGQQAGGGSSIDFSSLNPVNTFTGKNMYGSTGYSGINPQQEAGYRVDPTTPSKTNPSGGYSDGYQGTYNPTFVQNYRPTGVIDWANFGLGLGGLGLGTWQRKEQKKHNEKMMDLQEQQNKFYEDQVKAQEARRDQTQANYESAGGGLI